MFVESVDDPRNDGRRNPLFRQFLTNQGHGGTLRESTNVQPLRNDGSTLDSNFIVFKDADHVQPMTNDTHCLQTYQTNASGRNLLEYIRQMEERYAAMEKELTSSKMLIPVVTRPMVPMNNTFVTTATADHANPLMDSCQRIDEKQEPETSCRVDSDVKHEDHTQAGGCGKGIFEGRCKVESTVHQLPCVELKETHEFKGMKFLGDPDTRCKDDQGNRGHWNHPRKSVYEKEPRSTIDPSNNLISSTGKNDRVPKRVPIPRSNVHTASTPMHQSTVDSNPSLDIDACTVPLLRLAVLLYAPSLMPALNALIARQNDERTRPVPCSEGSNDLLSRVFQLLNSQYHVPNLSYAVNPQTEEDS